jgi:hypothetical protein
MQPWPKRVVEEANLFNPAFCSMLIGKTASDYQKKSSRALPFPLAFIVLPIVLHNDTRHALPHSTITSLLSWVQENREVLVDFALRMQRLRDITRETILFATQLDTLALSADGGLIVGDKHRTATDARTGLFTDEARQCVERAGFLGRWFAAAGTTATIYAAWGVTP